MMADLQPYIALWKQSRMTKPSPPCKLTHRHIVRNRFQPWHLAVLVVLLGAVAVAVGRWYPELETYDAPRMLATLPADHATLLYPDAGALRKDGILALVAGSKAVEEPEYRQFVGQTGFDYRTDLDGIAASFAPDGVYFIARTFSMEAVDCLRDSPRRAMPRVRLHHAGQPS